MPGSSQGFKVKVFRVEAVFRNQTEALQALGSVRPMCASPLGFQ